MPKKRDWAKLNDRGFASIVIAFVMIVLLTLTTIGFAELVRKEQRSATDKHLSNQAFYAAETGINDTAKALAAGFNVNKTKCGPYNSASGDPLVSIADPAARNAASQFLANSAGNNSNDVGNTGTSYSCLLINPTPDTIEYGSVPEVESKVTQLSGVDSAGNPVPINTLKVSWQDAGNTDTFMPTDPNHPFPPKSSWNSVGVLRISLTPVDPGQINRQAFAQNTYTAFLYPNGSNASIATGNGANTAFDTTGEIINGNCQKPPYAPNSGKVLFCNVEITGLTAKNYLVDLRSIYSNTRVSISGKDSGGNPIKFANSQTVVDSTGKAQDVLRRIQVRIPTRTTFAHSDFGLESLSGICKQLKLVPPAAGPSSNGCTP